MCAGWFLRRFAWNVGVHYVGCGIGEPGGQLYAPFNAFTGGKVPWVKLPHVHDRLVIGERYVTQGTQQMRLTQQSRSTRGHTKISRQPIFGHACACNCQLRWQHSV